MFIATKNGLLNSDNVMAVSLERVPGSDAQKVVMYASDEMRSFPIDTTQEGVYTILEEMLGTNDIILDEMLSTNESKWLTFWIGDKKFFIRRSDFVAFVYHDAEAFCAPSLEIIFTHSRSLQARCAKGDYDRIFAKNID